MCQPRAWPDIPERAWVTVQEIAEWLRESDTNVRKRVDRGEWAHTKLLVPKDSGVQRVKRLVCKRCVDAPDGDCRGGA